MKICKHFFITAAFSIALLSAFPAISAGAENISGDAVARSGYSELACVDSVVQPAATIFELREFADLSAAKDSRANIVIGTIDERLNIVCGSEKLCTVTEFLEETNNFSVPAFEVEDEENLSALVNCLREWGAEDVFVVSKNPELLYSARQQFPLSRGVLDLRGREISAEDVVKEVNRGYSKIVFLDAEPLTVEFVDSLRKHYLSVWAEDRGSTSESAVKTILTGVNGIATDSFQVYSDVYQKFFGEPNSIVRNSFIIGHRGSGATEGGFSVYGPENTLESAQKAYADGADYIEIDVHFTLDKELVVMHDSLLGTMMNASGTVEATNYSELKNYTYKNFDDSYRIPTLKQFIEYFKPTDCMLVIELKDYSQALAEAVADLIREYDFESQCVVICFSKQSLKYMYDSLPEVSLGALSSEDFRVYEKIYDEKHDVYKNGDLILDDTLRGVFGSFQNYNCAYNPGYNVLTKDMVRQIQLRGVGVQAWTLASSNLVEQYMMQGCASLTIDGVAMLADSIRTVSAEREEYTVTVGETANVKLVGKYYSRSDYEGNETALADLTNDGFSEPLLVSGDSFEVKDGKLRAVKEGRSVAIYRYKMFSSLGEYYIYSQPFALIAKSASEKRGCGSLLKLSGLTGAGIVLILSAVMLLNKKEKSL